MSCPKCKNGLNELPLLLKQSFKFLNAFCFSLEQQFMFLVLHRYQIYNSVIIRDTVKVMDYPSFWQRFSINFLPNYYMFKNIIPNLPGMVGLIKSYITCFDFHTSTLPIRAVYAFRVRRRISSSISPTIFHKAASTTNTFSPNWLTAIYTSIKKLLWVALLTAAAMTSNRSIRAKLTTVYTRMFVGFTPFFIRHIFIINKYSYVVKAG